MAGPLKEFLRRLRGEGGGWSYAVFLKAVQRGSSLNLVWGDGDYGTPSTATPEIPPLGCEAAGKEGVGLRDGTLGKSLPGELGGQELQRIAILVENTMKPKVHLVGHGILGTAVLTGNHRWIVHAALSSDGYNTQGLAEFNNQWFSGIQTIAIIPVLPHGVMQLGSTQMMMENIELINQTRRAFAQFTCALEPFSENLLSRSLEQGKDSVPALTSANVYHQGQYNRDSSHLMQPPVSSISEVNQSRPSIIELPVHSDSAFTGFLNSLDGLLQRKVNPNMKSVFCRFGEHQNGSDGHYALSDLNMMLNKQLVGADMKSDNQCAVSNSAPIPSDSPLSLQQLFSSLQAQNMRHADHSMRTAKYVQPSFHGPPAPSHSATSTLILPYGRGEPMKNENVNERFGSLLGRTDSNARNGFENKPSQVEASRIVDEATTSSNCHPHPSATNTCLLSEADGYAASAPMSRKHKTKGDFLQAPQISHKDLTGSRSSTCSDVSYHETGRMLGVNLQARRAMHNGTYEQRSSLLLDDWSACSHDDKALASLDVVDDVFQVSNVCSSGSDLFDVLGFNHKMSRCTGDPNALVKTSEIEDDCKSGMNDSARAHVHLDKDHMVASSHCAQTYEALPDNRNDGSDELLDAVVSRVNCTVRQDTQEVSCRTSLTRRTTGSSYDDEPLKCSQPDSTMNFPKELFNPSRILQTGIGGSATFKSSSSINEIGECSRIEGICNSQNNLWVDNENMRNDIAPAHCKMVEDTGKVNRKRPKPGENPRPRPKDRQMIQDRLKELREIVPNGAKLSIDALLEHTIKHMLFLQSVTKHADKLKETREPKIISEEGGLLLKDNFEGGATWAFEVGSQSMVCPIIVEDLNPPRQLLVEMLCEQRGLFLEIADLIKGLGLTILKGVMEARNDKVWARFAVEANRDVTRMDIFLSLVQLLEPRAVSSVPQQHFDGITMVNNVVGQPIAATGGAVNPMM